MFPAVQNCQLLYLSSCCVNLHTNNNFAIKKDVTFIIKFFKVIHVSEYRVFISINIAHLVHIIFLTPNQEIGTKPGFIQIDIVQQNCVLHVVYFHKLFGCCMHSKAGPNTFFLPFSDFLYLSTVFLLLLFFWMKRKKDAN